MKFCILPICLIIEIYCYDITAKNLFFMHLHARAIEIGKFSLSVCACASLF